MSTVSHQEATPVALLFGRLSSSRLSRAWQASSLLWLSVLVLLGLGLRLFGLSAQPLWWDEGYSMFFATESPWRLFELTSLDIHPPLYYLLLQAWMAFVGVGALQARLLSVLVGVVTLPVMWWVARPLVGRHAAWVATLLLALSPFHVYYSQEVRMYGLVALLALLTVGAWHRRAWWALGVAGLVGLLTHYYFTLLLVALALLTLRDLRANRYHFHGPVRSLTVIVLGYLPWMLYSAFRLITYVGEKLVVEADEPMTLFTFLPRHLVAWSSGHLTSSYAWLAWMGILFAGLALIGTGFAGQSRAGQQEGTRDGLLSPITRLPTVFWLWLLPTLSAFLTNLVTPYDTPRVERQLLYVLPFFLILVAKGLVAVWERWSPAALALCGLIVGTSVIAQWSFYTIARYPGEDYRSLIAQVGAQQGPGDAWLAIYPWQVGYLRAYLPDTHPTPIVADLGWDSSPAWLEHDLQQLLKDHPRVWFPAYQVKGRLFEEKLVQALNQTGVQAWNEWEGNTRLYLYGDAPAVPPLQAIGTFEEVGKVRAAVAEAQASSGVGILPLFFQVEEPAPGVRASMQLVGRGSVWGEWDAEVTGGVMRAGLPVMHGTPPGEYAVQMMLYWEDSGQPLDRFEQGERRMPEAIVGTVFVVRPPSPLPVDALRLVVDQPEDVVLGDTVRFVGASVLEGEWLQGEQVPMTLFWQAIRAPSSELHVFVQALDEQGTVRAARDLPPVNGTFSTTEWQVGDLVRDPHRLDLPADLPPGIYRLIAGLYDPSSGNRLAVQGGQDAVELGTLSVAARPRVMEEPRIGVPTGETFGTRARLARLALPDSLEDNIPLDLTLVWQATETGGPPLRAFVQLYHDDIQLAVSDHELDPPASGWLVDEWIVDRHTLSIPMELPPGKYRLVVGLYDPNTGERLQTSEGEWATVAVWQVE
ncbi:MAG: glycosyltransferase family 39 protein [Chloroflexota bacterium]|nr:glycosyltransferase family 39 protein [Chloroflexota bacterium]